MKVHQPVGLEQIDSTHISTNTLNILISVLQKNLNKVYPALSETILPAAVEALRKIEEY